MKKFFLRLGELICVVLLGILITYVCVQDSVSTAPFEKVKEAVLAAADTEGLTERDALEIKNKLSLEGDDYAEFLCFSGDSVMDVRELLIIRADNKAALEAAEKKISKYVTEKAELFDGYAPEESQLISSHVLTVKKGYLLFYIGEEKEKAVSAFSESL